MEHERTQRLRTWLLSARCRLKAEHYSAYRVELRGLQEASAEGHPHEEVAKRLETLASLLWRAEFPEGHDAHTAWLKEFRGSLPAALRAKWREAMRLAAPASARSGENHIVKGCGVSKPVTCEKTTGAALQLAARQSVQTLAPMPPLRPDQPTPDAELAIAMPAPPRAPEHTKTKGTTIVALKGSNAVQGTHCTSAVATIAQAAGDVPPRQVEGLPPAAPAVPVVSPSGDGDYTSDLVGRQDHVTGAKRQRLRADIAEACESREAGRAVAPRNAERLKAHASNSAATEASRIEPAFQGAVWQGPAALCVMCRQPPIRPKVAALCGHFACETCWERWVVQKFECPVCRKKVRPNNLIRLRGWGDV